MKNLLRLTIASASLALSFSSLQAQNMPPTAPAAPAVPATPAAPAAPVVPSAAESTLTISLPANLKVEDIVSAVTKGFKDHKWANVTAEKNTVTANHSQSGVSVKATAVCTATEVTVTATYTEEGKVTPEKAKGAVQRWLRNLEKSTKENLGLAPQKGEKKKTTE